MAHLPKLADIDRLLIVKTSSIGDVVHALPVVEAIRHAKPELTIGWVVRRRCADVLIGNPFINRLHIVGDKPDLRDLDRLRRELGREQYQCALDMQGLFLSGVYAVLSGAPIRMGLDRNREQNKLFMTHPVVHGKPAGIGGAPDRHAVDILYGFAEVLGIDEEHTDFAPQPYLGASGKSTADRVRALPSPRIGLNVGASSLFKRWPIEYWTSLADQLVQAGYSIVFVGDKHDAFSVDAVIRGMRHAEDSEAAALILDLTGKTNLRELSAALEACDIVATADTGPMHIAVAVGTPVVALFGATNPDRTGPYGRRNLVLSMHLPCSPCYRRPTCAGRVDCMHAITPDMVFTGLQERLAAAGCIT